MSVAERGAAFARSIPLLALLAMGGCEDRSYPEGFAEQAARDETAYLAAEAEKAAPSKPEMRAATTVGSAASQPSGDAPPPATSRTDDAVARDGSRGDADGSEELDPRLVDEIVEELALSAPPPVEPTEGDEPYQKLARDRKFDEFRRMCARYVQLKRQLLPLGRKLAEGVATPEERALHNRIEDAIAVEFPRLNRYIWDERWSEDDRAAMGWIMFVRAD